MGIMNKTRKAIKICRKEGIMVLLNRSLRYFRTKLKHIYWNIRRTQSFTVENVTATYYATPDAGGDFIRMRHKTEDKTINDFIRNLRPNDVFYDIGACIGTYTCLATQKISREGEVISFEPYPPNASQLMRNISLNDRKTKVLKMAVSDKEGEVGFSQPNNMNIGFGSSTIDRDQKNFTVKTNSIDNLVAKEKIPKPNVVKIDVEGAEPLVIKGMRNTLKEKGCRLVYCEIHLPAKHRPSIEDYNSSPRDLRKSLEDFGFETEILARRGNELHLKAYR